MPEFIPEHTPNGVNAFTQGYLDCAEWLLDEDVNRDTLRGWTKLAITKAKADCEDFMQANKEDLEEFIDTYCGSGYASAGHDFFLTRNRHGAGFWDRGDLPCCKRLTDAAHVYGEADTYVVRGWMNFY